MVKTIKWMPHESQKTVWKEDDWKVFIDFCFNLLYVNKYIITGNVVNRMMFIEMINKLHPFNSSFKQLFVSLKPELPLSRNMWFAWVNNDWSRKTAK